VAAEGTINVTVDKVCAASKLTKRYFYEGFADLDELLLAAADQLFERLYAVMVTASEDDGTVEARIRAVLTAVVGALDADPRGARLYVECPGHPGLRARREEAVSAFTTFVFRQVLPPGRNTKNRAFKTRILVAGATDLITGHLDGSIAATTPEVVTSVTQLALTL
jgi:AcrR family transcriptional regulator